MKITGREIIDTLEEFSELEWYRYSIADEAGHLGKPPVVVWRFSVAADDKNSSIMEIFKSILEEVDSLIEWSLRFTGRNWVLIPNIMKDLMDKGEFDGDQQVLDYLVENYPDLSEMALNDLKNIADAVSSKLTHRGIPRRNL